MPKYIRPTVARRELSRHQVKGILVQVNRTLKQKDLTTKQRIKLIDQGAKLIEYLARLDEHPQDKVLESVFGT